jgi:hypothetical protein
MPLTIPQIRARLHELADETGIEELAELADATRRRPPLRVASVRSRPIDPAVLDAIRAYAVAHPDTHAQEIAEVFNVNHGRVSEALIGKRGDD